MRLFLRFPLQKTSSVMPLLYPRSKQLIFFVCTAVAYRRLLRSDNPIFSYTLRCLLWAWQLDSACNTVRNFISTNLTFPHCRCSMTACTFLYSNAYRPVHSQVRQIFLSFSPYAFYRPPTYRIHHSPLNSFRSAFAIYGISQPTLPSFWHNRFPQNANRNLGEAFRGVTPSFHFLDYQFYETDCINSFQFYTFILQLHA